MRPENKVERFEIREESINRKKIMIEDEENFCTTKKK